MSLFYYGIFKEAEARYANGGVKLHHIATWRDVLAVAQVSALANYPHIYSKMNYTDKDFAPVSIAAIMHHGLAVGPMVPASVKNVKDFLAWAKANPKDASYGSPGAGSTPPFPGRAAGHQQRCGPAPCALPWLHPRYDGRGGRSGGCHVHAAR